MSTQQIESVRIGASQASSVPAGPWEIEDSVKFNDDKSTHFTKTWTTGSTNTDKWTYSVWVKRSKIDSSSTQYWLLGADDGSVGGIESNIKFQADRLEVHLTTSDYDWLSDQLFRDVSNWYHILVEYDSDNVTPAERIRVYVNGDRILGYTTVNGPMPISTDGEFTKNGSTVIVGAYVGAQPTTHYFDGYMAEAHLVDGSNPSISSFGTRGIYNEWKPIQYTGTHGTNGFYLDFKNTSCVNSSTSYDAEWTDDVNTRLLVKSNTTDGSTTFTDTHGTYSLGVNGNVHHEVDQLKYGTTSMHFDGTGDYLSSANSLMNFGTSDFTIEGWVYPTANDPQAQAILGSGSNVSFGAFCRVFRDPNGYMYLYPMTAGGSSAGVKPWAGYLTSNIVTKLNEWSHFAFVREGDIWTVLINGCVGDSKIGTAGYSVSAGAGSSYIGKDPNIANFYFTGYMDEIRISNVARYTQASLVTSSSLGADASGNLNHLMPSGLIESDQVIDTPSNNFSTLNPLDKAGTLPTFGNTNLYAVSTTNAYRQTYSTFAVTSGKWYAEVCLVDPLGPANYETGYGVITGDAVGNPATDRYLGQDTGTYRDGGILGASGHAQYSVLAIAVDADAGKLWYYNGTSWASGSPTAGTSPSHSNLTTPIRMASDTANSEGLMWNFGQDATFDGNKTLSNIYFDSGGIGEFFYNPPTGFKALCSKNLPTPAVIPSEHFNTVLYAGSGSVRTVTGVGFQPDLVWIHGRNDTSTPAVPNCFYDVVRGVQRNILIGPDSNSESVEVLNTNSLMSFDSDGFGLSTDGGVNSSSYNYASWNWKAGGTAVANTDGTTTSSVSANATAGFSIATYTGNGGDATIGHGLSKAPEMIIIKNRTSGGTPWDSYHKSLGEDSIVYFSHDDAASIGTQTMWNSTSPTASVFTVRWQPPDTGRDVNRNGDSFVAYSFHSVDGFSKVGSYYGNGDASDNTFVHCGFKPAYVFIKRVSAIEHWWIFDSARSPHNLMDDYMKVSSDEAEVINHTSIKLDFLSNGFKIRGNNSGIGLNGQEHIFMAFAEEPFKHSTAK